MEKQGGGLRLIEVPVDLLAGITRVYEDTSYQKGTFKYKTSEKDAERVS